MSKTFIIPKEKLSAVCDRLNEESIDFSKLPDTEDGYARIAIDATDEMEILEKTNAAIGDVLRP